jgi:hypothetical protein
MESTERAYYQALFRRDFGEARRLFRVLACSDHWTPDHLLYEGHKCGIFDEGDEGPYADTLKVVIRPEPATVRAGTVAVAAG